MWARKFALGTVTSGPVSEAATSPEYAAMRERFKNERIFLEVVKALTAFKALLASVCKGQLDRPDHSMEQESLGVKFPVNFLEDSWAEE
ncbi:hypothetical protein B0H13DRAFT_2300516 [Mycena leptocephala]|nr:hypothetical protein B0H13DRAFT_2300516 [Mycena leptocephala]